MVRLLIWVLTILFALAGCYHTRPSAGGGQAGALQVEPGRAAFMRNCNGCHPGGDAGLGPALNNKRLPGFIIKTQVRLGLGAMPRFSKKELNDSELNAIVEYLKAQRSR